MSTQVNQRQATYNAITSAIGSFEDGTNVKEFLTPEIKKEAKNTLFAGFRSGLISYSAEFGSTKLNNDVELNKYCIGLISNWTKKDPRLNGDVKYAAKNPGSRAGQTDEQVKELRKLLKQVSGTPVESEVKKALDARVSQIKTAKSPAVSINIDALPENLRHLVK